MNESHEAENTAADPEMAPENVVDAPQAAVETEEIQELERLQQEVQQLREDVLRERAEAENVRKRAQRDVESAHKFGLERLVNELLPVKDSMDLGLAAAAQAATVETLVEGVSLTAKMFDDVFGKLNITAVDPTGERFDPEFHQAMMTEVSGEAAPGTVLRVMQKGYLLNERLLRPALVVVAKAADDGDA